MMTQNLQCNASPVAVQLFHVVAVNSKTGKVIACTDKPLPHHEACTNLSKFRVIPERHMRLQPV